MFSLRPGDRLSLYARKGDMEGGKRALPPWPREARSPGWGGRKSHAPCDTRSAAESRATLKRISLVPQTASGLGARQGPQCASLPCCRDGRHGRPVDRGGEAEGRWRVRLTSAPERMGKNEFARISHLTDGVEESAKQMNARSTQGSIEEGLYADLVVIDRNPFRIPVTDIHDTKVRMTLVNGEIVYQAKP